jgi:putative transposase
VKGRKRHLLVDTDGRLLGVRVHPADEPDGTGARPLLLALRDALPRLALLWVDGGYKTTVAEWVEATLGWQVEAVRPPGAHRRGGPVPAPGGFRVLPHRWVVERTFAWLGRQRRLSKDYEGVPETEEAWIELTMIRLLTTRLACEGFSDTL